MAPTVERIENASQQDGAKCAHRCLLDRQRTPGLKEGRQGMQRPYENSMSWLQSRLHLNQRRIPVLWGMGLLKCTQSFIFPET